MEATAAVHALLELDAELVVVGRERGAGVAAEHWVRTGADEEAGLESGKLDGELGFAGTRGLEDGKHLGIDQILVVANE